MSWGELTCGNYGTCKHNATPKTCIKGKCKHYKPGRTDYVKEYVDKAVDQVLRELREGRI